MRITLLRTRGTKIFSFERFKHGFYMVLNLIPKHFGIYIEVRRDVYD